jgi:hypothetical protein
MNFSFSAGVPDVASQAISAQTLLPEDINVAASGLLFSMLIDKEQRVRLQSLQIFGAASHMRLNFKNKMRLSEIFNPDALDHFEDLIGSARETLGVLVRSEFKMVTTQTVFAQARIMTSITRNGCKQVIIRFAQAFGDVLSIFKGGVVPVGATPERVGRLAEVTLESIFIPLFNISDHIKAHLADENAELQPLRYTLQMTQERIESVRQEYDMLRHVMKSQADADWPAVRLAPASAPLIEGD